MVAVSRSGHGMTHHAEESFRAFRTENAETIRIVATRTAGIQAVRTDIWTTLGHPRCTRVARQMTATATSGQQAEDEGSQIHEA